jgi:hypothetical protein
MAGRPSRKLGAQQAMPAARKRHIYFFFAVFFAVFFAGFLAAVFFAAGFFAAAFLAGAFLAISDSPMH